MYLSSLILAELALETAPGGDMKSMIYLVLAMVIVLVAAYYTTKFLSGMAKSSHSGSNMEVIEQLFLGKDRYIVIVRVGDNGYVLSYSGQNTSLIDTLSTAEVYELLDKTERLREDRKINIGDGLGQAASFFKTMTKKLKDRFKREGSKRSFNEEWTKEVDASLNENNEEIGLGSLDDFDNLDQEGLENLQDGLDSLMERINLKKDYYRGNKSDAEDE